MLAEIIAVGSELLGSSRLDTNSLWLARELSTLGIRVARKDVLADDLASLAAAIGEALQRTQIVICCGGLGPTRDDLTREAAAQALHCRLVRDPAQVAWLQAYFRARGRIMPENNLQQADRLESASWLPNPLGTAPGQWCVTSSGALILLPGPPRELERLFTEAVRPRLRSLAPSQACCTRSLHIVGMPESQVDALAAPIYLGYPDVTTTILSTAGPRIELHFQAYAATSRAAQAAVNALADRVAQCLGDAVFSRDGESLAAVVGKRLRAHHQTLALAESCTGGLIGERLTQLPGASEYFLGGVVCYSNRAKRDLLGVLPATLETAGAVSSECARELASGARRRFGSSWGLSVTGIAGPGGATPEKPVGTVWLGLAGPDDDSVDARLLQLQGDRDRIRQSAAQLALDWLRLQFH